MNMEDVIVELMNCQSGMETINKIWEFEKSKQLKIIVFLWRWWSARNKVNEGGRLQCVAEIQGSVTFFLLEFEKLEANGKTIQSPAIQVWKPSPENFYKINNDGAYNQNTRIGGWGWGSKGEVLLAGAGMISRAALALQTEVVGALKRAAQLGMTHIILETDASVLASALRSIDIDRSADGCLVCRIQELMRMDFSCCSLSLCNRSVIR